MTDSPQPSPTDPGHSCSVLASAGTGKTWQLVARISRLLINGAPLQNILAITFTRKAAGEMQERLNERLREFMEADDNELDSLLKTLGEIPDGDTRQRARSLFETVLRSEQSLRATTFHSFCQDLLQRFPLEAGIPPGFELVEQTGLLITEAWDALIGEVTRDSDSVLAGSLQLLFDALNGPFNTRTALFNFVKHRSDWWAFVQDQTDSVQSAIDHLSERLEIDSELASGAHLWNDLRRAELARFLELLRKHKTPTNAGHADILAGALASPDDIDSGLAAVTSVFLTKSMDPRKRKASGAQAKSMGEAGQETFLALHAQFCERLAAFREHRNRAQTLATNSAWYRVGDRLLEHYQRIKRERRLLDFADLEWHAYRLLNHPDQAHWVQYKLDQRIDQLLIDEFQDTNPTQWRLLKPLLDEMAAGGDRWRSLFVVGDAKQSIYRFRRGNPRLLGHAADWMQAQLSAPRVQLAKSWRSSPLIMDTVNRLFQHDSMAGLLTDFQPHSTHLASQWGRLELWPLVEADECEAVEADHTTLRNPLETPRPEYRDDRHYREGLAIAERIRELLDDRLATPNDILVLLRSRTHLSAYEAALRDGAIPYLSQERGTLLDSLEIRDMEALLKVLITPQDNLSLAQVLKSPLFALDDDDLLDLSGGQTGYWFDRLIAHAEDGGSPLLQRAAGLLTGWHALAGRLPIHDLLETIYHQSNLAERYKAAFPAIQGPRVQANLVRFVELALEVDAGRYPTLPRFLDQLQQLRTLDKEGPDQATPVEAGGQRVRLLTIHASKGLEAPVVFVADSASTGGGSKSCQTLVRWPADSDRPEDFMLLNRALERDSISRAGYESEQQEERREAANLLYVALTRARNMLVISGCRPGKRSADSSWYQQLCRTLLDRDDASERLIETHGEAIPREDTRPATPGPVDVDPRLSQPIQLQAVWHEISPSRVAADQDETRGDPDGTLRGLVIHRLLQLASDSRHRQFDTTFIPPQVADEFGLTAKDARFEDWCAEAERVLQEHSLSWLFEPPAEYAAHNEIPLAYRSGDRTIHGIIDRLLVTPDRVHLIDYKTHRRANRDTATLVAQYQPQLTLYRDGIRKLWPDLAVTAYLLFTESADLVEVAL